MGRSWPLTVIVSALVSGGVCLLVHALGAVPVRHVDVPSLRGLGVSQARDVLGPRRLLLVIDGEKADDLAPGTLVQQRPLGGSQVHEGTEIHVTVAAVPPPVPVAPAVPPPAAPGVAATPPAQVVVPPSGAAAPLPAGSGAQVAAATDSIPSLVGKRLPQAREIARKAGFVVGAIRHDSDGDVGPDKVLRQYPTAGTRAVPGARIDLVVNE